MPEDPRTDDELVRIINRGPPEAEPAFAALFHRHKDWCLRLARRMTTSDADAADVAQEAFITLLRQFPGFRLRGRLTTFLYPVVRNRALAAGRRRSVLRLDQDSCPEAGSELSAGPLPIEFDHLRAAVADLPEPQREVLLMRLVDDMEVAEVATALGIPPGTVKSRLHTALATLRSDPRARPWHDEKNPSRG